MEVQALGPVWEEALLLPHPGLGDGHVTQAGDLDTARLQGVDQDQAEGEEEGEAPASQRVNDELDGGGAPAGDLGPQEGPAEIETHHRHPGDHGEGEEIPDIPEYFAMKRGQSVRAVIDENEVRRQEQDGDNIADHDLAVETVELGNRNIHEEGDDKEHAAGDATDGVDEAELRDVIIEACGGLSVLHPTDIW